MEPELKGLRIDRSRKRSQPSRGAGRWIFGGIALIAVSAGAFYADGMLNRATDVDVVRVHAATAGDGATRAGDVILNATGYIVAAHTIELGSKVVGKVLWIGVDKGDKV